jgi:hypothetical protein
MLNLPQEIQTKWLGKYHQLIPMLTNFSPRLNLQDKLTLLDSMTTVTFVRHPFVRLVSAFQDKVVDSNHRNWRRKVSQFPTSHEKQPNFEQFVDFILDMKVPNDGHISFFWMACDMCHIEYDVIGKPETINEDMAYIFQKV